ncbi:MAG: hypothetical protein LC804_20555, partial [Acidobacteria bacterium]|nr:hypothetical protein [Acidobacteriota bacterium]
AGKGVPTMEGLTTLTTGEQKRQDRDEGGVPGVARVDSVSHESADDADDERGAKEYRDPVGLNEPYADRHRTRSAIPTPGVIAPSLLSQTLSIGNR